MINFFVSSIFKRVSTFLLWNVVLSSIVLYIKMCQHSMSESLCVLVCVYVYKIIDYYIDYKVIHHMI